MSPAAGRARRPEQKEDRRRQIKDAARAVFDGGAAFSAITMADVAARAGLAKGTGYLYFPTKEALFLDVLVDELEEWFAALVPAVLAAEGPDAVARVVTGTLLARPRLLELLSLLHAVLEQNLDSASARAFKTFLADRMVAVDAALAPAFPGFGPGDVARLLLRLHALVVGLVGMSRPPPVVAEALAAPELAFLRVDLGAELEATLAALIRGAGRRAE